MGVLEGRIAIITGAGRGIGRGIARSLAREGASIAIAELDAETGPDAAAELRRLGGRAISLACDVRERAQVEAAVLRPHQAVDELDLLRHGTHLFGPQADNGLLQRSVAVGSSSLKHRGFDDVQESVDDGVIGGDDFL